jgi:hypothetical protein
MHTHSGGVLAEIEGKKFVTGTPDCQWDENILRETIMACISMKGNRVLRSAMLCSMEYK